MEQLFRILLVATAIAVDMASTQAAEEAATWPAKPITFVVPFTPGGITDINSRVLAKLLGESLGQSVMVENRPGAGGSIGVEAASRRPPDGYTMIYGTQGTHAVNPALYKNVQYDPIKDFVPVHGMTRTPLILVVNASKTFDTVARLVTYAKANPGKLNFGSAGPGTGTHLTAELFQIAAGVKMTHVPYKGSSPALTDLVAGNIDLMFDYPVATQSQVKAGKLRALAVTSKERLSILPDLPTVFELGYPGAQSDSWSAVFLPAGTPPVIAKRLGDAIANAIVNPKMLENTEKFGSVPLVGLRDEKLGELVASELVRWRDIVKLSGATVN